MKQLLTILLFLCSVSVMAQDVIVKKDGSTVLCKVLEVTASEITYKKWSDLKGSSYIIDKSLVSAINYENGKKEVISELEIIRNPEKSDEGKQSMSDADLLKLDEDLNSKTLILIQKENQEKEYLRIKKKVKRLKTWGWIGGGVLAAGGIAVIAMGISEQSPHSDVDYVGPCCGIGVGCIVLGAGVTTLCLIKANKEKKKLDALQTSSIYRYDIPFSNGSSLSVGADLLNDRITNQKTIGLGLNYNF